jgi:hypothetical protein
VFWLKWEMHNRSAYPNTYVTEGTVLTSDINILKCRYGDLEDTTDMSVANEIFVNFPSCIMQVGGFFPGHQTVLCALGSTQPLKMSTRIFLGVKTAGAEG